MIDAVDSKSFGDFHEFFFVFDCAKHEVAMFRTAVSTTRFLTCMARLNDLLCYTDILSNKDIDVGRFIAFRSFCFT